ITTSDCCCRQMVPPQLLEFGHFRKVLLDKVLSMIAGQRTQPVSQDLGVETAACSSQVDGAGELIDVTARIEGCRHPGQAFLPEAIAEGRGTFDWYGGGGMPSSFGGAARGPSVAAAQIFESGDRDPIERHRAVDLLRLLPV